MRKFLARLTTLRASYPDFTERQQAQHLLLMNLFWIVVTVVSLPLIRWWLSGISNTNTGILFFPLTALVALVVHELIQRGRLRLARRLFVANVLLAASLSLFPDYRLDSPFIVMFSVPLTAAGVLLRRSRLSGVALLLLVMAGTAGLAQIVGDMRPTPLGDTVASVGTSIVLVFIMVGLNTVMLWSFIRGAEETAEQQQSLSRLIAGMAQVSHAVTDLSGAGDELNRVVEQLRDMLRLYHVQIFLTDAVSGAPVLQASTGVMGRRLLDEDHLLTPDENSPIHDALRRKDPIVIRATELEPQPAGFLPATRAEVLLPLRVGNLVPFGVLDLHSARADAFSDDELHMLAAIANQIAAAIYHIRQAGTLRASLDERDQLAGQVEGAQRETARLNRQLVGATWGTYLQAQQSARTGLGWRDGAVVPPDTESEILVETMEDGRPRLEQRGETSVLCVPIRLRGQTLGAVEFRRPGAAGWSSAALELAQIVAERLALSLENARLFEQAQTTAQREQLVSQITSQLQTATDLQSLLTLAAARFQDALGATQTSVRLGGPPADDDRV